MRISPKITVIDRVNAHLGGDIPPKVMEKVKKSLSWKVAGCHIHPAFQLGHWDGRESLLDENGLFYVYHADLVFKTLSEFVKESEIEITFECPPEPELPTHPIDDDYMEDVTGLKLRTTQLRTINDAIAAGNGIFDAATSAGKTLICGTLARYYQDHLQSITIVPSAQLLQQTHDEYTKMGLDSIAITATGIKKNDKRLEAIRNHQHTVITYKLLFNLIKYAREVGDPIFQDEDRLILYDECHEFGDTMFEAFKMDLSMCTVRFGMSGTVPKDQLKYEKICGSLGFGVISTVSVDELRENGYISKVHVKMFTTKHKEIEKISSQQLVKSGHWDWDKEFKYFSNTERVMEIARFISNLDPVTTLVLCHAQLGNKLGQVMDLPFIDQDTPTKERQRLFKELAESNGGIQLASYDTSGTGISVNEILRVVIIDAGKNETHIKQGIGRGLRLDGVDNKCEVIDISADTYFAKKHRNERIKVYKRDKYPYTLNVGVLHID